MDTGGLRGVAWVSPRNPGVRGRIGARRFHPVAFCSDTGSCCGWRDGRTETDWPPPRAPPRQGPGAVTGRQSPQGGAGRVEPGPVPPPQLGLDRYRPPSLDRTGPDRTGTAPPPAWTGPDRCRPPQPGSNRTGTDPSNWDWTGTAPTAWIGPDRYCAPPQPGPGPTGAAPPAGTGPVPPPTSLDRTGTVPPPAWTEPDRCRPPSLDRTGPVPSPQPGLDRNHQIQPGLDRCRPQPGPDRCRPLSWNQDSCWIPPGPAWSRPQRCHELRAPCPALARPAVWAPELP
ncbi:basic proline-rich protein-like [Gopherus evgoodei]|uniref:basic proline-rich protein-like n=1 Tax=Gopherus evgoodei TaxID=1825980 RepID=UPI0011CEE959|nr:basic proline-rich protein-like [Gopherus evgoodei]